MLSLVRISYGKIHERPKIAHKDHERSEMRRPIIPDLTNDQREQLKQLRIKYDKESLAIHNHLIEQEAHLTTLTTSEKIKSAEIGRVIQNIGDLKTKLMELKVSHMLDMKESLTSEQVIYLNNYLARRPKKRPHQGR